MDKIFRRWLVGFGLAVLLIGFGTAVSAASSYNSEDFDLINSSEESVKVLAPFVRLPADNSGVVEIAAKYALVMDMDNEKILYNKSADQPCQPASTTKMLTTIIGLEQLKIDEEITVGKEINSVLPGSSIAGLVKNERLTTKMLLQGLLLPSGNDAALVLATNVAKKDGNQRSVDESIKIFCDLMNKKAKDIGAVNSNFSTPDGYDNPLQHTTAYDLSLISAHALRNNLVKDIVKEPTIRTVLLSGEDVTWNNTNKLLSNPIVKGAKTGSTVDAGSCLITYVVADGRRYLVTVMKSTPAGRWEDTNKLIDFFVGK